MASAGNLSNITIGACSITVNNVPIGHTLGGSKLTLDRKFAQLEVDQYGKTPVDLVLIGQDLKLETTLAEPTLVNLDAVIPESQQFTYSKGSELSLGVLPGVGIRQYAVPVQLHPLNRAATDLTADVLLYLAVNDQPVELNYEVDKQRTYKVVFRALVSEGHGVLANGEFLLGQIGVEVLS